MARRAPDNGKHASRFGGDYWLALVLGLLVGLAAIVGASVFLVRYQLDVAAADWIARESALAHRAHDSLAIWIDERIRDARMLGGAHSVARLLDQGAIDLDLPSAVGRLDAYVRGYGYLGIYVRDRHGEIVARSSGALALPDDVARSSPTLDLGDRVRVVALTKPVGAVAFSTPVVDAVGGWLGDLVFVADLRHALAPVLGDVTTENVGQRFYLARRAGADIFVAEPWGPDASPGEWVRVAAEPGTSASALADAGLPSFARNLLGISGAPVFASARRVEPVGWSVLCEIDRDVALAHAYALGRLEVVVGVLTFFVMLALGYVWRREVLVRDLHERMEAFAARARLAAIVESTSDAIVGVDATGLLTTWNSAAELLFGYRASEVLGKSPTILSPPEIREESDAIVRSALRGLSTDRDTVRIDKLGRRIDVNIRVSPVHGTSGQVIGTAAILRDITARKRADEALRMTNEALDARVKFETLLGSVSSSLLAIPSELAADALADALGRVAGYFGADEGRVEDIDASGRGDVGEYVWVRPLAVDAPSSPPPAAGERPETLSLVEPTFVSSTNAAPGELLPVAAAARARGVRSWAAVPLRAGGEHVAFFELSWRVREIEFADESRSQVLLFAQVFANVLLRLRRENDLRRANDDLERRVTERTEALVVSERRWQQLFEDAPDAMMLLDAHGIILQVSARLERIFLYDAADLVGRHAGVLFGSFDSPPSMSASASHAPLSVHDVIARRADGTTFPAAMRLSRIASSSGSLLMASLRDMTAERQLAEHLRSAAKLKDEFLAGMSHELRTPLTAILGFTESLLVGIYGVLDQRQRRALESVQLSGEHLLGLINDVLDLSKVEAGRMTVSLESCHVAEICRDVVALIRPLADAKAITLRCHVEPSNVTVHADDRRLRQMLLNLLSNAVKFTDGGGQVDLDARPDAVAGALRFRVKDTGIGIAAADIPKLFQLFAQVDSGLARRYDGTGIGLALVHRMAELHHGSVEVESEVGKGSCFTLILPWSDTPDAARGVSSSV